MVIKTRVNVSWFYSYYFLPLYRQGSMLLLEPRDYLLPSTDLLPPFSGSQSYSKLQCSNLYVTTSVPVPTTSQNCEDECIMVRKCLLIVKQIAAVKLLIILRCGAEWKWRKMVTHQWGPNLNLCSGFRIVLQTVSEWQCMRLPSLGASFFIHCAYSKAEDLNLGTTDILDEIILCCGGCLLDWKLFSGIPGLYPWDAICIFVLSCDNQSVSKNCLKSPAGRGCKITPG